MDLTLWSMSHYRVSALKSFLVYLGANPYRCQYCRCNFVSLRRRKYKFSFRNNMQEKKTGSEEAATAQMDGSRET